MATIRVPVEAYILTLYPQSIAQSPTLTQTAAGQHHLEALARGLAVPSFWSRHQVTQAFDEANRIWKREADIEFSPVTISERDEAVPSGERGMWIHFLNNLAPRGRRGIGAGFVYDLPSEEGGWGGGRIAVVSGRKVSEGLPGFAGTLLAHELGHVLIDDPLHALAGDDRTNLMYGIRNPRVANAGLLNDRQIESARIRALAI